MSESDSQFSYWFNRMLHIDSKDGVPLKILNNEDLYSNVNAISGPVPLIFNDCSYFAVQSIRLTNDIQTINLFNDLITVTINGGTPTEYQLNQGVYNLTDLISAINTALAGTSIVFSVNSNGKVQVSLPAASPDGSIQVMFQGEGNPVNILGHMLGFIVPYFINDDTSPLVIPALNVPLLQYTRYLDFYSNTLGKMSTSETLAQNKQTIMYRLSVPNNSYGQSIGIGGLNSFATQILRKFNFNKSQNLAFVDFEIFDEWGNLAPITNNWEMDIALFSSANDKQSFDYKKLSNKE